ncbi:MAG: metal-dependent hydrolase [Bacteroidota bacterium]
MQITYYGHASFLVEIQGKKVLFDPFISPNELAKNIDISRIHPDYILLSHGHQDHVADALSIAQQSGAMIVISWYGQQGYEKCYPLNHGGATQLDFGTVKYVNAVHSSVLPDGTYGGNPGGFVCTSEDRNFYFAGDTALTLDMQLIPKFAPLDVAILPIGDGFTMGYEDAIIASDFINCNQVIGMHYDTFPFIKIDKEKAQHAFKDAGKELILMDIGESREF